MMRTRFWGFPLLWAAAAIAAGANVAWGAEVPINDEQEIRALQARMAAAVNARNLDAVMKEYVPGKELFVFDSDLPRQHSGWESYKKDWGGALDSAMDMKVDVEDLGITVVGKAAFSHSLDHLIWTRKRDGSRDERLMSVTDAYRKIDGKWLIVMEHWSIPVEDGKAVFVTKP
jgi:ketosteroid isomerase-like protein